MTKYERMATITAVAAFLLAIVATPLTARHDGGITGNDAMAASHSSNSKGSKAADPNPNAARVASLNANINHLEMAKPTSGLQKKVFELELKGLKAQLNSISK